MKSLLSGGKKRKKNLNYDISSGNLESSKRQNHMFSSKFIGFVFVEYETRIFCGLVFVNEWILVQDDGF